MIDLNAHIMAKKTYMCTQSSDKSVIACTALPKLNVFLIVKICNYI